VARPEVTGKKNPARKKKESIVGDEEIDAASIPTFCRRHGISVAFYYLLKAKGLTPREVMLGTRVLITKESSADWRKAREAAAKEAAAAEAQ
jgi:hypothetical protein